MCVISGHLCIRIAQEFFSCFFVLHVEHESSDSCKRYIKRASVPLEGFDLEGFDLHVDGKDFIQEWQVQQETFRRVRFISVHSRYKLHCRIYACDFCGASQGSQLG